MNYFSNQEINNECLAVCDGEFFDCTKNCENSECSRKCFEELDVCENSCPCGADCPTGCVDCPEHPLCADECEDAQLNNNDYKICLNDAIYELDICLKTCPPQIGCHNSCYENYTEMLFLCPCIEQESDVFILVIGRTGKRGSVSESYLQSGDGSSQVSATIDAPYDEYTYYAAHALVNGKLHIFGGAEINFRKIARLDDCSLIELSAQLNREREAGHSALSINDGTQALICFGYGSDNFSVPNNSCEIFDSASPVMTFSSNSTHGYSGLGLYRDQPTTVGCWYEEHNKAETLSSSGWTALPDHPLRISTHALVGLENKSMLLLGGYDSANGRDQAGIWQLQNDEWSLIGVLKDVCFGSALYIGKHIYYFATNDNTRTHPIHQIEMTSDEQIQSVEVIGYQPDRNYKPVLFQVSSNYCV
ncbi:unnamed protein product [Oikopleura dioica]|uniref:Uncharacterized protein n=1 Tax=Oikopleura dioica TaxID=34765 RepID=E4XZ63_OIKDI|nr:unnamed protein product [Oikopleura dioica]